MTTTTPNRTTSTTARRKRFPLVSRAALAGLLLAGCAATGTFMPNVFSITGKDGALLATSGPTDFSGAVGEDGQPRLLDQVQNRGELDMLVLDMPNTEARLNTLLTRVTTHWPHPLPQPARVKLSMKSEYSGATFADGTISVGLGTFAPVAATVTLPEGQTVPGVVSSDEELLYLLAHEFAHYALGHHRKTDSMQGFRSLVANLTETYNTVSVLKEMRYQGNGENGQIVIRNQSGVAQDIDKAIGAFDFIAALSSRGLGPAWNRGQEDEADVLALDLMKAAGLDAPYYEAMFANLHAHESFSKSVTNALQTAMAGVQQQLLNPNNIIAALDGQSEDVGDAIMDFGIDMLTREVRKAATNYFGQTHRDPEVRRKGVETYLINAYPGLTADAIAEAGLMAEYSTTVIDAIKADPEFEDARRATVAYYKSIALRSEGDYAGAEAAIMDAMATRFGREAAIQFEAARVAESSGAPDLAISRYRAALSDAPMPDAFKRLARVLTARGLYAEAEQTIAKGEATLNDTGAFLPSRIALAVAREDVGTALALLRTCRKEKRTDVIAACEASHSGLDYDDLSAEQKAEFLKRGEVGDAGGSIVKGLSDILSWGK
jgi:tetratricopeptide (TPR) repeat protein